MCIQSISPGKVKPQFRVFTGQHRVVRRYNKPHRPGRDAGSMGRAGGGWERLAYSLFYTQKALTPATTSKIALFSKCIRSSENTKSTLSVL